MANLEEADEDVRQLLRALASAPRAWVYSDVPARFRAHALPTTFQSCREWVDQGIGA